MFALAGRLRYRRLIALLIFAATTLPVSADTGSLELVTRDRFTQVLAAERGKTVVLNLWATWCVPCLREIPDLMRLEDELQENGVVLVALGMDDPNDFARVDAFRTQHFPEFSSYLRDSPDMDSLVSIVDPVWNELLPTTYLLDPDGDVIRRIQGKQSFEDFYDLVVEALE